MIFSSIGGSLSELEWRVLYSIFLVSGHVTHTWVLKIPGINP